MIHFQLHTSPVSQGTCPQIFSDELVHGPFSKICGQNQRKNPIKFHTKSTSKLTTTNKKSTKKQIAEIDGEQHCE